MHFTASAQSHRKDISGTNTMKHKMVVYLKTLVGATTVETEPVEVATDHCSKQNS